MNIKELPKEQKSNPFIYFIWQKSYPFICLKPEKGTHHIGHYKKYPPEKEFLFEAPYRKRRTKIFKVAQNITSIAKE